MPCRAGASAFFVVYPSSTSVKLECAFPQESTSAVEWLDTSSSSPITLEGVVPYTHSLGNNTAVVVLVLSDSIHGLTCKGISHNGHAQYKQYLLVTESEYYNINTAVV